MLIYIHIFTTGMVHFKDLQKMLFLLITVWVCSFLHTTEGAAVMSLDLGSEFMKIAIVKPGVPMEIVLNKESGRKTRTIVAMRDGERMFSDPAYNTAVKFPKKAYWFLTQVLGHKYDDPQVELYRKRFPYYDIKKDEERGTVLFQIDDETSYSPEELLAMILENARDYAETFAEQPIKDIVITVPAFFNQAERRSVLQAASMVGLNVLQLMGDNAAVALNFGVFRRKMFNSTMQYYMFYDMGSSSTTATIVGYQVVKHKDGGRVETNPQVVVKGVGFDRNLGGLEMTLRLRDHLAREFNKKKKTKTDVFTNDRAMGKLYKEAMRVKQVLSANMEHYAQVEGLLDEEDFKTKVTRAEFDLLCEDLFKKVTKPIDDALKASEITMQEITEVIMMGGGTRVPWVKEILIKHLGGRELGKSINTDEAAALGAVYQGAYMSKGFKVKPFGVKEATIYPMIVEFDRVKKDEDGTETIKTVKRTLFGHMNPYPQKKVMTFNKHYKDFHFGVNYGDLGFLSEEELKLFPTLNISSVMLVGVEDVNAKHADKESKGVKAHFRMNESGVLTLDVVECIFEHTTEVEEEKKEESTWSKLGNTLSGLWGGGDKADKDVIEKTADATKDKPDAAESASSADQVKVNKTDTDQDKSDKTEEMDADKTDNKDSTPEKSDKKDEDGQTTDAPPTEEKVDETAKKTEEKQEPKTDETKKNDTDKDKTEKIADKNETETEKKPMIVVTKEEIKVDVVIADLPDISPDALKACKKRLSDLRKADREKDLLLKAQNELEAFVYDMNDKLTQDAYMTCSTETERELMSQKLAEASDWLYEQEEDTKKEAFIDRRKELSKLTKDLIFRVKEGEELPKALDALHSMLNHSDYFLKSVKNLTEGEDPIFTEVEATTLSKLINETREWRDTMVKDQKKTKPYEKPVLLVEDLATKFHALDREVKYLINKAKNYRPKAKPEEKVDKNATKTNTTINIDEIIKKAKAQAESEAKLADSELKDNEQEIILEDIAGEGTTTSDLDDILELPTGEQSDPSEHKDDEEEDTILELGEAEDQQKPPTSDDKPQESDTKGNKNHDPAEL